LGYMTLSEDSHYLDTDDVRLVTGDALANHGQFKLAGKHVGHVVLPNKTPRRPPSLTNDGSAQDDDTQNGRMGDARVLRAVTAGTISSTRWPGSSVAAMPSISTCVDFRRSHIGRIPCNDHGHLGVWGEVVFAINAKGRAAVWPGRYRADSR